MKNNTVHIQGFSIIEVLIGIFVFSMGLVSIYALLVTSLRLNDYNQNAVVASNLAREQIEIIRNIRDTNYKLLKPWNLKYPQGNSYSDVFEEGVYYKIQADPVTAEVSFDLISDFQEGKQHLVGAMQEYRVCQNSAQQYIYCKDNDSEEKTPFYKYVTLEKIEGNDDISDSFILISRVIWNKRGYHDFELKTILTDWRRI